MHLTSKRERRLWSGAATCLSLIYASAFVARPIADFLRDRNLLRLTVAALIAVTGALALRWVVRSRPGWRATGALTAIAGLYLLLFYWTAMPEERLHLLEYGLLAGLIYAALAERQRNAAAGALRGPSRLPAWGAIIATALCGWVDEGIQFLLPDRYYDLRDIALNAVAGVLAVLALEASRRSRYETR